LVVALWRWAWKQRLEHLPLCSKRLWQATAPTERLGFLHSYVYPLILILTTKDFQWPSAW
jgi:hypothetical protein